MIYNVTSINIIGVLSVLITALVAVAFITIAERKTMASMQRRLGPNFVGYYGLLQPFADALKLLIKEYVAPTQSNIVLFFLGPIITLIFALYGYAMVPYGPGISICDFSLGLLYMLAVSSLATYGILLAGWSANSKYAFLGSLRSTAQLISYELILSSVLLVIVFLTGTLNLSVMIEVQRSIWYIVPLIPLYIIFFISSVAETNRAPFDLAEAESELVSGFMTEHSASIFVFFFLAEYASIILMCILITIVLLGGYEIFNIIYTIEQYITYIIGYIYMLWEFVMYYIISIIYYLMSFVSNVESYSYILTNSSNYNSTIFNTESIFGNIMFNGLILSILYAFVLGLKTYFLVFVFIWVRASYPRIRFDQLMSYCWTVLLPIVIAFIIITPCFSFILNTIPYNINLI